MKLYGFHWSPFSRKVQMVLDLMREKYEWVEVPYCDRTALAQLTGGYVHVPVLEDGGAVVTDSRTICERLLARPSGKRLAPAPFEGPVWGYSDFCDGVLEDVMFRIASPAVRDAWKSPGDRALYVVIKERKFGAGCVDAWERDRPVLVDRARRLLAPTLVTLSQRPFLFGDQPTLADAALYGSCKTVEEADGQLLARIGAPLAAFVRRLEAQTKA